MNQTDKFLGLCPACYKPIKANESIGTINNGGMLELCHALCINKGANREEWIASNLIEWKVVGEGMRGMREDYNISIRDMAKSLGVSIARINRFEKGEPVRDAKLIYSAYILKIYGDNTYRNYLELYNQKHGIDQINSTPEIILNANRKAN